MNNNNNNIIFVLFTYQIRNKLNNAKERLQKFLFCYLTNILIAVNKLKIN